MYGFLENPKGYMPGTKMGYNGMRRSEDRGNMIAYLASVSGTDLAPYITEAVVEEAPQEATDAAAPVGDDAAAPAEEAMEAVEEEANAIVEEATTTVAAAAEAVTEEATEVAEAASESVEAAAADVTAALTGVQEDAAEEVAAATEAAEDATTAATETVAEATEAVTEAAESAAVPAFMASADPAAGEQVYRQCRACHVADAPTNRVGPHLVDVVGREKASIEGFRYSDALSSLEGNWGYEELNGFLENPRAYAPGTRMTYNGLRNEQDRANVIAYLESLSQ
jgi:cytochrome c2